MSQRQKEASGILIYLVEELGDARLRCSQLKHLVTKVSELVEKSTHRDHLYEVAGDVIYGIPDLLFKLDKALDAAALAASKLDYEEIKQGLRPEKVDELEEVMKDVRLRYLNRRSKDPIMTPKQAAEVLDRIADTFETAGQLPVDAMVRLIAVLEKQDRVASSDVGVTQIREVAALVREGKQGSRLEVAKVLRGILADNLSVGTDVIASTVVASEVDIGKVERAIETTERQLKEMKHALDVYQKNPGKNAPQLENLVSAAQEIVKILNRFVISRVKTASEEVAEAAKESRFEEGKPADPTENMSPEDAKQWREMHDKYQDTIKDKQAAGSWNLGRLDALRDALTEVVSYLGQIAMDVPKSRLVDEALKHAEIVERIVDQGLPRELARVTTASEDKQADSGDPADLAHDILEQGLRHPALAAVSQAWEQVEGALKKAGTEHKNMHRYGIGSTEDVTLVNIHVLKSLVSFRETVEVIIEQLGQRLKRRSASIKESKTWSSKGRLSALLGSLAEALTHLNELARDVPNAAKIADKAYHLVESAEQIVGRDLTREMSLPRAVTAFDKESCFEAGKPADPTENMSPEDAKVWREMHEKYKDTIKDKHTASDEGDLSSLVEKYASTVREAAKFSPGDKVKVKDSHGSAKFRGDTGEIEKLVPIGKYYVDLKKNGRSLVDGNDLEKI